MLRRHAAGSATASSAAGERLLPYRPLGALRLFLALLVMLQHYLQWCYPGPVQQAAMIFEPGNVAGQRDLAGLACHAKGIAACPAAIAAIAPHLPRRSSGAIG